ncbi:LysR family transcriptional regulator [Erwinia psidii]|uniref:LysR family transcriptional regulator n=1 Tax=Erwinia psidii TaxID=69224 RepID=UPI00226B48F4|nr:LysR family transcriptional regulator [Erwinia psidii]MCX8960723.1 LysR family transcriptional regulator [Erwinia psidii]
METMRDPPLYALKAFEAASRHQSFTKAANELSITQSAISKHINTLEGFLDCRLFIRNGPKVKLTQEGEYFSKEIQMIFNSLDTACGNFFSEKKKLRIRAPTTFSLRWFIGVVNKFQSEEGQGLIRLDGNGVNGEVVDFNENIYDCAIQFGNGNFPQDCKATRLLSEWLIPVCAPGVLSEYEDITNGHYNILYSRSKASNWFLWCERALGKKIHHLQNGYEFNTIDAAISAAVQGLGIAIVDVNMVRREINNKTLICPVRSAVRTGDSYFFVWPEIKSGNRYIAMMNDYLKKLVIEKKLENINYIE